MNYLDAVSEGESRDFAREAAESIQDTYRLNSADKVALSELLERRVRPMVNRLLLAQENEHADEVDDLHQKIDSLKERAESLPRRADWPWRRPSVRGYEIPEQDADLWQCGKRLP